MKKAPRKQIRRPATKPRRRPAKVEIVNTEMAPGNVTPQRVLWAVRNRFNPLRSLTPEVLARQLDNFAVGYLRDIAITWETMERRDLMMRNVSLKRKKSVARNGWEILTIPNLSKEEETEAAQHKAALEFFYNNLSCTSVLEQNERGGLSLLLRQMMDAVGKRYAVHEIVWRPQRNDRAPVTAMPSDEKSIPQPDVLLTAEFRFVPLWFFEARTGRLRYLEQESAIDGKEMVDREWMVTVGDGIMEACSIGYMFKSLPLKDWLALSEKFGMPGLLGKTDAPKDSTEWSELAEAVRNFGQDWAAVCNRSAEIVPVEVTVSGGTIPQPELVAYMDRMIASLWRGADLATIAQGDDAVGASLQGDEGEILLEDDLMLCEETLNEQASKVVIQHLFGTSRCLAYIKLRRTQEKNTDQDIKVDEFLSRHGVPLSVEETLERYERAKADDGEATLQAPRSATPEALPMQRAELSNERSGDRRLLASAVGALGDAQSDDLREVLNRLAGILEMENLDVMRAAWNRLKADFPEALRRMNEHPATARVLEEAMVAGFFNGAAESAVGRSSFTAQIGGCSRMKPVIPAPAWLVRRMEKLRRLPPPTAAEVDEQWRASAKLRKQEFCNAAEVEALCHFTNDVAPGDDGWAMIAPYGDYPGMATITEENGSRTRVRALQRLDRQAANTMVHNFKSMWGRVKRYVTGTPIFLGHPDGAGIGHLYADKMPKGVFADIEARDTGLFGKPVFTNEGIELLPKFPALSGRWTATEIGEEVHQGERVKVFRPDVLKSAGLTNKPNLPVELLNELEAAEAGQTKGIMKKEKILALLKKHGVELSNDATDEQIEQALDKMGVDGKKAIELANEKATLEGNLNTEKETVTTKTGEINTLTTKVTKLEADFSNERAARRDLLLDQALHEGRISPAEKAEWKGKLDADFANESVKLAKKAPVLKTTTQTGNLGQRTAEFGNVRDRQIKVTELVNEEQRKGMSYDDAFNKVRREHKALFDQMHQPERQESKAP